MNLQRGLDHRGAVRCSGEGSSGHNLLRRRGFYLVQKGYRVLRTKVNIAPPWVRFSMDGISAAGLVPMPKRSALKKCRRELSEDVSFGNDCTLFGCRAIELGNRPPPKGWFAEELQERVERG